MKVQCMNPACGLFKVEVDTNKADCILCNKPLSRPDLDFKSFMSRLFEDGY